MPENVNIGIHLRRGDFLERKDQNYSGKFNTAVPIDWYVNVCRELRKAHPSGLSFCLFSDATMAELKPIFDELGDICIRPPQLNSDVSDMLALSSCDVQICSVSSFSMWAAFLSHGRYVWFSPNLIELENRGAIWKETDLGWFEGREQITSLELEAQGYVSRGIPVSWDGAISSEMHEYIERLALTRRRELDLLMFGTVIL